MGREKREDIGPIGRLIARSIGNQLDMGPSEDPAEQLYPLLWDWLTKCQRGDYVKEPPSIAIKAVPGGFYVECKDIDLNTKIGVGSGLLSDCFAALEQALNNPVLPVQKYGRTTKTLKKRKLGS